MRTRPSPAFWEGSGYEARERPTCTYMYKSHCMTEQEEHDLVSFRTAEHKLIITMIMLSMTSYLKTVALHIYTCTIMYEHIHVYLQNCRNVVPASLGCFCGDQVRGSALPPNMVTFVTSSTRQKAVVE